MGYTTDFWGEFTITPPLTDEHRAYLTAFNKSRRMARDASVLATFPDEYPDPVREAVGLPIGPEGCYFVGGRGFMGQDNDPSVLDCNEPPGGELTDWIIPTSRVECELGYERNFGPRCPLPYPHRERAYHDANGTLHTNIVTEGHACDLGIWRMAQPWKQPGLWCQWRPTADGDALVWDEGEKFYDYIPWLAYLLEHFLIPWGYSLSGEIGWKGEEDDDFGKIILRDNELSIAEGERGYGPARRVALNPYQQVGVDDVVARLVRGS